MCTQIVKQYMPFCILEQKPGPILQAGYWAAWPPSPVLYFQGCTNRFSLGKCSVASSLGRHHESRIALHERFSENIQMRPRYLAVGVCGVPNRIYRSQEWSISRRCQTGRLAPWGTQRWRTAKIQFFPLLLRTISIVLIFLDDHWISKSLLKGESVE